MRVRGQVRRVPSPGSRGRRLFTVCAVSAAVALAGCQSTTPRAETGGHDGSGGTVVPAVKSSAPPHSAVKVAVNVRDGAQRVSVDTPISVRATDGTLSRIRVTYHNHHRLPGHLSADKTRWRASSLLEPGTHYKVRVKAVDEHGLAKRSRTTFRTVPLTLDQQTYPAIAPLPGETVGVGMPVIVQFDVPVTNRASIERHLSVTSTPSAVGSWHWIDDSEVHWRPKHLWKPGTHVTVHADINGVNAGNGIYGQMDRSASFTIGDSVIDKINLKTDQMRVFVNGRLARKIPVTGGMPGWETRDGTKLIVEKLRHTRMDAATVGLKPGDPNYYDIPDVEYAMRVTYSGEFLHAAPWSVAYQGVTNVSHGCVGMSTANAAWLYGISHRGDVVRVHGSGRPLEPNNGWTDWNVPFRVYKQGSALH